ncbi:MAG: DUF1571 domain-containing protein [Phycisphaerae bacterium]
MLYTIRSGMGLSCIVLLGLLGLQCHQVTLPVIAGGSAVSAAVEVAPAVEPGGGPSTTTAATVSMSMSSSRTGEIAPQQYQPGDIAHLAQNDPQAFVRYCRDEYVRGGVRDYTCSFTKQEFINKRLGKIEEVAVRFREEPFSVYMNWVHNASAAMQALYVKNAWVDSKGRQLAWFKPSGALIRLFVPKIKQPINGVGAKKGSRRTLDQFGFRGTLDLIIKYNERGRRNNDLELHYVGESSIGGRMTWVFERFLPFTGQDEPYPDALLRYHIDQEWLVPTACYSYADSDGEQLLGSYVITDVDFNVGLNDNDFDPRRLGF